jgi:hypothetical protein
MEAEWRSSALSNPTNTLEFCFFNAFLEMTLVMLVYSAMPSAFRGMSQDSDHKPLTWLDVVLLAMSVIGALRLIYLMK